MTTCRLISNVLKKRGFHSTAVRRIDPRNVEEVNIPVPWGNIAGKWWGCRDTEPIVALHGGLDNANSFDNLIPLLDAPSVFCIDLPGHGQSSHSHPGFNYNHIEGIVKMRYLLKNHFKWGKAKFIAHSYGSSMCFAYAGMFPDDVSWMVNIECGRMNVAPVPANTIRDFRRFYSNATDEKPNKKEKGFPWEQLVQYNYTKRKEWNLPVSIKNCEILLRRGTRKIGDNLYVFTIDPRVTYGNLGRFTHDTNFAFSKRIKCRSLNILGKGGVISAPPRQDIFDVFCFDTMQKQLNEMSKNAETKNVFVEGSHHVHLEQPENISDEINKLINS